MRNHFNNIKYIMLVLAANSFMGCNSVSEILSSPTKANAAEPAMFEMPIGKIDGYDLNHPQQQMVLPDFLEEASGLTDVSLTEVAIVQDESGTFFVYDLKEKKVSMSVAFGPPGDYEGMSRVNNKIYILKSNGKLFEVSNWRAKATVTSHHLELPTKDNEGLGWDPVAKTLLIAPKSRWKKGKEHKNIRPIFAFNPEDKNGKAKTALVIDLEKIVRFAKENGLSVPSAKTKKGKTKSRLRFRPASIAVHPTTGHFYVISAVDRTLASFDRKGNVSGFQYLSTGLFRQPEGITFLPNNTMVIINEAAGHQPTLLQFLWSSK